MFNINKAIVSIHLTKTFRNVIEISILETKKHFKQSVYKMIKWNLKSYKKYIWKVMLNKPSPNNIYLSQYFNKCFC